jgi:tetratricopeptide (TPR) repeat protein
MWKIFLTLTLLILCFGIFTGCQTPEIPISWTLPSPVPLPDNIYVDKIEDFGVIDYQDEGINPYLKSILADRLGRPESRQKKLKEAIGVMPTTPAVVNGTIKIKIDDKSGIRQLRHTDSTTTAHIVEVPSLVRKVFIDIDFIIKDSKSDQEIATIETHQNYNSIEDPYIRGEWGFERPDDPERIPPVSDIIERLLDQSADSFVRMISPVEISKKIKLHSAWDGNSAKAFSAIEKGDWNTAMMYCQKALAKNPDNINLLFNMAVVSEANSDLPAALDYYRKVSKLTEGNNREAEEGIIRVERVNYLK